MAGADSVTVVPDIVMLVPELTLTDDRFMPLLIPDALATVADVELAVVVIVVAT